MNKKFLKQTNFSHQGGAAERKPAFRHGQGGQDSDKRDRSERADSARFRRVPFQSGPHVHRRPRVRVRPVRQR